MDLFRTFVRRIPLVIALLLVAVPSFAYRRPVARKRVRTEVSRQEPVVTLDVKDADVHVILASVQKQCGIRNLLLDPDVQGAGTFLFRDVPCSTALKIIFQSLGLHGEVEPNSVVTVGPRSR